MGIVGELRDGLTNLVSGAGTAADKRAHHAYALRHPDIAQIEAAYRSSWLMRKIVDLPPHDETRAWRRWQADPATAVAIETEERRLGLRAKLRRARMLARLHGGAAMLIGVGGDPAAPVEPAAIGRGALRYAHVLSRFELAPGPRRLDPEDPWYGEPAHFALKGRGGAEVRLHPSRVVPFVGQPLPQAGAIGGDSWYWGDPLMTSIEAAVKNADAAQNGFAALIEEAKVDVFGGVVTLLGVVGGGVKWAFASRSKREEWIEARIQTHVAKIEARLAVAERRADHLSFAFQLVAAELARLDPNSDILRRAQMIIEGVQGVFGGPPPRDLAPELRAGAAVDPLAPAP